MFLSRFNQFIESNLLRNETQSTDYLLEKVPEWNYLKERSLILIRNENYPLKSRG